MIFTGAIGAKDGGDVYVTRWDELPEQTAQPGNYRAAVMGRAMSLNRIRWVHPTVLPEHTHDVEQAVVLLEGRIEYTIDGRCQVLTPGTVAVVPAGTPHSGRSLDGEAVFLEVFAPPRPELLPGALGYHVLPDPAEEA